MKKPFSPVIKRLGTKTKIMEKLLSHFPEHEAFIEPFSGSGSVFFNKKQAKYSFLNDADANIALCYNLLQDPIATAALVDWIEFVPYSVQIWQQMKSYEPKNDVERVGKFLMFANWGFLGKPETLKMKFGDAKTQTTLQIHACAKFLANGKIKWHSCDFEVFLDSISLGDLCEINKSFIYCDPPYLSTTHNYDTEKWEFSDLERLILACIKKKCKFAISEFDSPDVLMLAAKYALNINVIGEVHNLRNSRTEILLTNYDAKQAQQKIF